MKTRTANILTSGILALGAIGALSLVTVANAKPVQVAPVVVSVTADPAPVVSSNCDKQRLADQLVRYLGESSRVVATVKDLPRGYGAWSLGGRIEINSDVPCEHLPRVIAHELGHELDQASGSQDPNASARQHERTAECIADRAFIRIYSEDHDPVLCSSEETARAALLAPAWGIR